MDRWVEMHAYEGRAGRPWEVTSYLIVEMRRDDAKALHATRSELVRVEGDLDATKEKALALWNTWKAEIHSLEEQTTL